MKESLTLETLAVDGIVLDSTYVETEFRIQQTVLVVWARVKYKTLFIK